MIGTKIIFRTKTQRYRKMHQNLRKNHFTYFEELEVNVKTQGLGESTQRIYDF